MGRMKTKKSDLAIPPFQTTFIKAKAEDPEQLQKEIKWAKQPPTQATWAGTLQVAVVVVQEVVPIQEAQNLCEQITKELNQTVSVRLVQPLLKSENPFRII